MTHLVHPEACLQHTVITQSYYHETSRARRFIASMRICTNHALHLVTLRDVTATIAWDS